MQFWREALVSVGAYLVMAAVMWFAALAPAARRRITEQRPQRLAYLATAAGLIFVVAHFWLAAAAATTADAQGAAQWLRLIDAAVLPVLFAAAIQASVLPPTAAWDARRLGAREINLLLLLSIAALLLLPGGDAGWVDALPAAEPFSDATGQSGAALAGAPWLAVVAATGVALFCGQIALHALRRPGAAVMVFAAALFYQATANFVFAQASGATGLDAVAHFLAFVAAIVMDAVYMIRIYAADERPTLWWALAMGITTAVTTALILLPSLAGYPAVTPVTAIGVAAGCAVLGLWCGWCGAGLGRWMLHIFSEVPVLPKRSR